MKKVKCVKCEKEIDANLEICPYCGFNQKNPHKKLDMRISRGPGFKGPKHN